MWVGWGKSWAPRNLGNGSAARTLETSSGCGRRTVGWCHNATPAADELIGRGAAMVVDCGAAAALRAAGDEYPRHNAYAEGVSRFVLAQQPATNPDDSFPAQEVQSTLPATQRAVTCPDEVKMNECDACEPT